MSTGTKKEQLWRRVFRTVMSRYDETKSVLGTNSCSALYNGMAQEGGRGSYNPRQVKVLPADFICDVELAARAALNRDEHKFFKLIYLDKDSDDTIDALTFAAKKRVVQEKVGRELQSRGIY